jgi:hypothetical protein
VELNQFQNEFRELANKFGENEKIIKKLSVRSESGTVARELRYKRGGGGRGSKMTFCYILLSFIHVEIVRAHTVSPHVI